MAKGKHDPNLKAECLRLRLDERLSYKQIQEKLGVPKGTLSYWLGEHPLTHEELDRLRSTPPMPVRKSRGEESELYGWVKSANLGTIQTAKVSEAAVMLRMLANGFNVFGSSFDGDVADWVVQVPGSRRFLSVQVKTAVTMKTGLPCCSLTNSRSRRYEAGEFDFIVGFDIVTDTAYVWSWAEVAHLKATVSITPDARERWDKFNIGV